MRPFTAADFKSPESVEAIKKLYANHPVTAGYLVARLVHDLTLMEALPAHVARLGRWWVVWSAKDWMTEANSDRKSFDAFHRIVPLAAEGVVDHFRPEILLTTFAPDVATFDGAWIEWI